MKEKLNKMLEQYALIQNKLRILYSQFIEPNEGVVPSWVLELRDNYRAELLALQEEINILIKNS